MSDHSRQAIGRRSTRRSLSLAPVPVVADDLDDRVASREERHLIRNHALISQNHTTLVHHYDRIIKAVEQANRQQSWLHIFSAALLAQLIFFLILALTTLKWSDISRLYEAFLAVTNGEDDSWRPMFVSLHQMAKIPRFSEGLLVYFAALVLAVSAISFAAKHPRSSFLLVIVSIAIVAALLPERAATAAREVVADATPVNRNSARGIPITPQPSWTPVEYHSV